MYFSCLIIFCLVQNKSPLKGMRVGKELEAMVIGHLQVKDHHYLPITHTNFTKMAVDLTLRQRYGSISLLRVRFQNFPSCLYHVFSFLQNQMMGMKLLFQNNYDVSSLYVTASHNKICNKIPSRNQLYKNY